MDIEDLKMKIFFKRAWRDRPVFCQCGCNKRLPKEINTACMDHLLEKSDYPECKFSLGNIFFCTAECHAKKTGKRASEKHKNAIEKALNNYEILKEESSIFEQNLNKLIYGEK